MLLGNCPKLLLENAITFRAPFASSMVLEMAAQEVHLVCGSLCLFVALSMFGSLSSLVGLVWGCV